MDRSSPEPPRTLPPVSYVGQVVLIAVALTSLAYLLWLGRDIVFVAFLTVLLAIFLAIFIDRLEKWRLPRPAAALLVFCVLVIGVYGFWALAWPTLQAQLSDLREVLPRSLDRVRTWMIAEYSALGGSREEARQALHVDANAMVRRLAAGAFPVLTTAFGAIFGVFVVVFGAFYLAIESRLFHSATLAMVPRKRRGTVRATLADVGHNLRRWMLGTAINMVVIGVLTTLGLWLVSIPAALTLGLLAGLLEFIPVFGPVVSSLPAIFMALITSPGKALEVILLYTIIQQGEANFLSPWVFKGTMRLPPALTILFQSFMAVLFGFFGLLIAVPALAVIIIVVKRIYVDPLNA